MSTIDTRTRTRLAALRKAPEDAPASWKFTEEEVQA